MDENTKSKIYLWIVIIGSTISIWVTFFIWIIYPDIAEGFIFAMSATWLMIFFFWTLIDPPIHYQVEELERELIELKKRLNLIKREMTKEDE